MSAAKVKTNTLKYLLPYRPAGRSVPETVTGATRALWRIAETNAPDELESVLRDESDINATDALGVTALMRAVSNGQNRMVRALLEHGADPNISRNDKFTPLMLAAFFGYEEIVRMLVEYGADIEAKTRFGTTAPMWANARTFHDVADYLQTSLNHHSDAVRRTPARKQELPPTAKTFKLATHPCASGDFTSYAEKETGSVSAAAVSANEHSDELLQSYEKLDSDWLSEVPLRHEPWNRSLVLLPLFLLVIVFVVVFLQPKQRPTELTLHSQPSLVVDEVHAATSAASLPESNTIPTADRQEPKVDIDPDTHTNNPEKLKTSTTPVVIYSARSSGRTKLPEEENVPKHASLVPVEPTGTRKSELPSTAASSPAPTLPPKPTSVIPAEPSLKSRPQPLSTELISPSKSSDAKGRVIKWP